MDESLIAIDTEKSDNVAGSAFLLSIIVCFLLAGGFAISCIYDDSAGRGIVIESKININTDPQASLERVRLIGPSKAAAIVKYRNDFQKNTRGRAFTKPSDLMNVKGIGPQTLKNLKPYLSFE